MPEIYSTVFGVEEEMRLQQVRVGAPAQDIDVDDLHDALALRQAVADSRASGVLYTGAYGHFRRRSHTSTGDKEYVDGYNLERSTAECSTVRAAVNRARGTEIAASQQALALLAVRPDLEQILHFRHTGFFPADTVGTQDNLFVPALAGDRRSDIEPRITQLVTAFCLTRPYMAGAGDYTKGRLAFAQKMAGLSESRRLYATPIDLVMCLGARMEVRENDINLCEAAAMVRLGGVAMCSAIAQTPLLERFDGFINTALRGVQDLGWSNRYNLPVLLPDGHISPSGNEHILWAADAHAKIADVFASAEMRHSGGEQPKELLELAKKMHRMAELMKAVIRQKVSLEDFAHVSDWATKHLLSLEGVTPDEYGLTIISRDPNTSSAPLVERVGSGFTKRDAGHFEGTTTDSEIERAYYEAPSDTRAALRSYVIQNFRTANAQWDHLLVFDDSGNPIELDFGDDPSVSRFTDEQMSILYRAVRR